MDYLKLHENQLTELPPGIFAELTNLGRLDLYGNQLTGSPVGVLAGLSQIRALWLDGNVGSPTPLELRMERTDTTELTAPGPATLVVTVDEGAAFDMRVRLSAHGATLSDNTVTIPAGGTRSNALTVTANSGSMGTVTVTFGNAPEVPQTLCDFNRRYDEGRGHAFGTVYCYAGVTVTVGDAIRLFR